MEEDLKKIAPLLSKIDKETLFKVPEGYFDTLADRILSNVKEKEKINISRKKFLHVPIFKMAASIIIIFGFFFLLYYFLNINKHVDYYSYYIFENINNFDEYSILEINNNSYDLYEFLLNEIDSYDIINILEQ